MSLLSCASPWEGESKKRNPSLRKTQKKLPTLEESVQTNFNDLSDLNGIEERPTTFEEDTNKINDRSERVNQLIHNMTNVLEENDGGKLADFNPVPLPALQKKTDEKKAYGKEGDEVLRPIPNHLQVQPPKIQNEASNFGPSGDGLGNMYHRSPYSNFQRIYEPTKMRVQNNNNIQQMQPALDNKLLEKINYMIHMLEQQENDKTSNITEEFVLYTLLGVFIIFIVDSFARTGKYIR